jgi:hypothetical protein
MAAIDYFASMYGTPAWTAINLYWNGTATNYKLYVGNSTTPLYDGTGKSYSFVGVPGTRYDFHLDATLLGVTSTSQLTTFTRSLPAPVGLAVNGAYDTLSWDAVSGATSYEIADVTDSYTVAYSSATSPVAITTTDSTRYSFVVRTVMSGLYSQWSAPLTFTTPPPSVVAAAEYGIVPLSTHVWQAGRAGSTSPAWRPQADDWFHGDGFVWGDNAGVQTTYFFYDSAGFTALAGATVTAFDVYVVRSTGEGDPGSILSRWLLHDHATLPGGAPTLTGTEHDDGTYARGESGWVSLPTAWADALIDGTASGIAWGGVADRYQVSTNTAIAPFTGCLRITVS